MMELLDFYFGWFLEFENDLLLLMIIALLSCLHLSLAHNNHKSNFKAAMIKRDDDLFQIRYEWLDTVVDFSGKISDLVEEYENFIAVADRNPTLEEENFYYKSHHVHNKIQRHMTKGGLIFPNENLNNLFKGFGESTKILHSQERHWMKEWSKFLLDLFEIEKLVFSLGPEIKLRGMKKETLFRFF